MAENEDLFETIQNIMATRLRSVSFFAEGVPVIAEDTGKDTNTLISDRIEAKIAEIGIVAIIMPPAAGLADTEETPALFFQLNYSVRVVESPVVNRSQTGARKTALQTIQHVMLGLHHFQDTEYPDIGMFRVDKETPVRRVPDLTRIIYEVNLNTSGGIETA